MGESSFMGVGRGSLLQIDGFDELVSVSSCEKKDFYFKFSKKDDHSILINRDVGATLSKGDYVDILSSTYETLGLSDIADRGSGYSEGDLLEVKAGKPTKNVSSNLINNAVFEVMDVDARGSVKKLKLAARGEYIEPPDEEVQLHGGGGSGVRVSLFFEERNEKGRAERQIKSIDRTHIDTHISFDSPLYGYSKSAELKVSKWKVVLNTNYSGGSGGSPLHYRVCDSVTEHLGLPFLPPNCYNAEVIYNKVIVLLDKKIFDLERKIEYLESRL